MTQVCFTELVSKSRKHRQRSLKVSQVETLLVKRGQVNQNFVVPLGNTTTVSDRGYGEPEFHPVHPEELKRGAMLGAP